MKILVVDRVKLFQKIIASVLDDTEIEYVFAETGAFAISTLEKDKYEIICVSMYLDDMDAIELSKHIRQLKQYTYTPIVLLTSDESNTVAQDAMKSGIVDIFEKKEIDQLVNFIRRFGQQNNHIIGRVLYIEDTLSQRLLVTEMLTQRGLEVDGFASGEQAIVAFEEKDYDIIVTDIVLDGSMSGVTLANKIRRLEGSKGDVPILAVTAFDNISRRIGLFHLGINDYVIKPIVEEELIARIKSLIENRRYVLEIQQERQTALHANAAKSEFLSLMSHELRTPLNSIMGNMQLMQMDAEEQKVPADFLESINEVTTASHHLLGLINEVLDLSKIEAGKMDMELASIQPQQVILSAIKITKYAMAERGISLHENFANEMPDVITDSARLKQALINLLSNAVKYNKDNGDIFVSAQYKEDRGEVWINIKDSGIGLSPEACQGIFEKFNRLGIEKTGIEGTGLGLYVTKKMLSEMHADIVVKSKLGVGTQFSIKLPVNR
ncbi:MAG: response regulator [Methylococcales bacterium]